MHSSNRLCKGSIFIEVVIALAMVSVILTTVFSVNNAIFSRVVSSALSIRLLLPLKYSFYRVLLEPTEDEKKDIPLPEFFDTEKVMFTKTLVKEQSILHRFRYLFTESAQTKGILGKKTKKEQLQLVLFLPPEAKKKS